MYLLLDHPDLQSEKIILATSESLVKQIPLKNYAQLILNFNESTLNSIKFSLLILYENEHVRICYCNQTV